MIQVHIFVSGQVQGVGYRAFTIHIARKMNIKGWTRNLSDGRVEVVAQGPKEKINLFTKRLWHGSMLSEVTGVVLDHEEMGDEYESFDKMPTF